MATEADSRRLTLEALRCQLEELTSRIAALEARLERTAAGSDMSCQSSEAKGEASPSSEVSPEVIAAIAAVLAAHLGVRPRIRQVRLVSGGAWAQQGRVTIQASHALAVQRD